MYAQRWSGWLCTPGENIERVPKSITRNPQNPYVVQAKGYLTIGRVLRRHFILITTGISPFHTRQKKTCRILRFNFWDIKQKLKYSFRVIFFLTKTHSVWVHCHNVRIWNLEKQHATVELPRDSSKISVLYAVSRDKVYGQFFFEENTFTANTYINMIRGWLCSQLHVANDNVIFQ